MTMMQGGALVSLDLLQQAATGILDEMNKLLDNVTFGYRVELAQVRARDDRRNRDDGFTPFSDRSSACIDHAFLSGQGSTFA